MSKGAKPSDSVYNLLIKEKVCQGKKIPVHKKKKEKNGETSEGPKIKAEQKKEVKEEKTLDPSPLAKGERIDKKT